MTPGEALAFSTPRRLMGSDPEGEDTPWVGSIPAKPPRRLMGSELVGVVGVVVVGLLGVKPTTEASECKRKEKIIRDKIQQSGACLWCISICVCVRMCIV